MIGKIRKAIKKKIAYSFRGELISDNISQDMKFIRFLSKPVVIVIMLLAFDLIVLSLVNFVVNIFSDSLFDSVISSIQKLDKDYKPNLFDRFSNFKLSTSYFNFAYSYCSDFFKIVYYIVFAILLVLDIKFAYQIRANFSRQYVNKGSQGTAKWTTLNELDKQYKKIELYPKTKEKTNFYKGQLGLPVSRFRDKLYLDTNVTNNLYLGTTQSGKDECFVYTLVDVCSRVEDIKQRASMIIFDPKMESYKSQKKELEKRGYDVSLLNLDNPKYSMGYNPFVFATTLMKGNEVDRATSLIRSFSFNIFNNDKSNSEPIWKTTSTDLFTSLILAVMTDCLEIDKQINKKRRYEFKKGQKNYDSLEDEKEKEIKKLEFEEWLSNNIDEEGNEIDYKYDNIPKYIPTDLKYNELIKYEKNINPFFVISFFKKLLNTKLKSSNDKNQEKVAENMLNEYFNNRPDGDYAKSLFLTIEFAGARTKGSIFVNMQSAISIFLLGSIRSLTEKSDVDFNELGFGEKPVAIFISIPTDNTSNHFIASVFISQSMQYLTYLARSRKGKLDRRVVYNLNEFGNLPQIADFNHYVTNCVGMGITFNIFIHAYNQIDAEYEKHSETIKENFPNQFYIMSIGNESAEFFSKNLGNKTVITAERTGTLFGKKSFMERIQERPLFFPDELTKFRMGECALYRGIHRRDNLGNAIKPYPVINEYQDNINFRKIIIFFTTIFKRIFGKAMFVLDTGDGTIQELKTIKKEDLNNPEIRKSKFTEELAISINNKKRWLGTSMLFRYEYAEDTFPSPRTIDFKDVCDELIVSKHKNITQDIEKILNLRRK